MAQSASGRNRPKPAPVHRQPSVCSRGSSRHARTLTGLEPCPRLTPLRTAGQRCPCDPRRTKTVSSGSLQASPFAPRSVAPLVVRHRYRYDPQNLEALGRPRSGSPPRENRFDVKPALRPHARAHSHRHVPVDGWRYRDHRSSHWVRDVVVHLLFDAYRYCCLVRQPEARDVDVRCLSDCLGCHRFHRRAHIQVRDNAILERYG
jgi:hypothetical protein